MIDVFNDPNDLKLNFEGLTLQPLDNKGQRFRGIAVPERGNGDRGIFLRGAPKTFGEVHRELKRLLMEHGEDELKHSFCVVETGRHRIRHL